jgi:hypothetical protein
MSDVKVIPPRVAQPLQARLLGPHEITEYERQVLESMGYDGESPIPSNLADNLEVPTDYDPQAEAMKAAMKLPEGFRPPTAGVDMSSIKVEKDPSVIQQTYMDAMQRYSQVLTPQAEPTPVAKPFSPFDLAKQASVNQINEAASARINPASGIANAIEQANMSLADEDDEDDIPAAQPTAQTAGTSPEEPKKPLTSQEQQRLFFKELKSTLEQEDIDRFTDCVLTGQLFTKTYTTLGGRLKVTFAEESPDDLLLVTKQDAIDGLKERYNRIHLPSVMETQSRYLFMCMLKTVEHVREQQRPINIPVQLPLVKFLSDLPREALQKGLTEVEDNDTLLRLWQRFVTEKAMTGSTYQLVYKLFDEFRGVLARLRRLAQMPDFTDDLGSDD